MKNQIVLDESLNNSDLNTTVEIENDGVLHWDPNNQNVSLDISTDLDSSLVMNTNKSDKSPGTFIQKDKYKNSDNPQNVVNKENRTVNLFSLLDKDLQSPKDLNALSERKKRNKDNKKSKNSSMTENISKCLFNNNLLIDDGSIPPITQEEIEKLSDDNFTSCDSQTIITDSKDYQETNFIVNSISISVDPDFEERLLLSTKKVKPNIAPINTDKNEDKLLPKISKRKQQYKNSNKSDAESTSEITSSDILFDSLINSSKDDILQNNDNLESIQQLDNNNNNNDDIYLNTDTDEAIDAVPKKKKINNRKRRASLSSSNCDTADDYNPKDEIVNNYKSMLSAVMTSTVVESSSVPNTNGLLESLKNSETNEFIDLEKSKGIIIGENYNPTEEKELRQSNKSSTSRRKRRNSISSSVKMIDERDSLENDFIDPLIASDNNNNINNDNNNNNKNENENNNIDPIVEDNTEVGVLHWEPTEVNENIFKIDSDVIEEPILVDNKKDIKRSKSRGKKRLSVDPSTINVKSPLEVEPELTLVTITTTRISETSNESDNKISNNVAVKRKINKKTKNEDTIVNNYRSLIAEVNVVLDPPLQPVIDNNPVVVINEMKEDQPFSLFPDGIHNDIVESSSNANKKKRSNTKRRRASIATFSSIIDENIEGEENNLLYSDSIINENLDSKQQQQHQQSSAMVVDNTFDNEESAMGVLHWDPSNDVIDADPSNDVIDTSCAVVVAVTEKEEELDEIKMVDIEQLDLKKSVRSKGRRRASMSAQSFISEEISCANKSKKRKNIDSNIVEVINEAEIISIPSEPAVLADSSNNDNENLSNVANNNVADNTLSINYLTAQNLNHLDNNFDISSNIEMNVNVITSQCLVVGKEMVHSLVQTSINNRNLDKNKSVSLVNFNFLVLLGTFSQSYLDKNQTESLLEIIISSVVINEEGLNSSFCNSYDTTDASYIYPVNKFLNSKSNITKNISKKAVSFNNLDGSNTSPPNDRINLSWLPLHQNSKQLTILLKSISEINRVLFEENKNLLVHFVSMLKFMSLPVNKSYLIRLFNSSLQQKYSESEFSTSLDIFLPEMVLHIMESLLNNNDELKLTTFVPEILRFRKTQLRFRTTWMISSVIRYQLRWLLDMPPPCISVPNASTTEIIYDSYRSEVWKFIELAYLTEPLLIIPKTKNKLLLKYISDIDKSVSSSDGSNCSYLFTTALKQITELFRTIVLDKSVIESPFELIENILFDNNNYSIESVITDKLEKDLELESKAKIAMTILGAEFARQFLSALFYKCQKLKTTTQVIKNCEYSIWDLFKEISKSLSDIKCFDEYYLYVLSFGYDNINKFVSKPLIGKEMISSCKSIIDKYHQILFKDIKNRDSIIIDNEVILKFPKVVLKK